MKRPILSISVIVSLIASTSFAATEGQQEQIADPAGDAVRCSYFFFTYFGLNSFDLSSEAKTVTSAFARVAIYGHASKVIVIGYADTSEADDIELSRQRANAVAGDLVANGIDRAIIQVRSKGRSELPVPTPDHTPEPLNRRVMMWPNLQPNFEPK